MQQQGDENEDEDEVGGMVIASVRTSISVGIGTGGRVGFTPQHFVALHIPFIGLVFGTWRRDGVATLLMG